MKKQTFRLLLCSLLLTALNLSIIAQQRWAQDPRLLQLHPADFTPLPQNPDNRIRPTQPWTVITPIGTFLVNPNFRTHPNPGVTQSEVIIIRHPLNQNIMWASANVVWPPNAFGGISEAVHLTTNGGLNWFGWDTLGGQTTGHGGDPGPTIDKNDVLIMTHLGYPTSGMFANYSTNMGVTWSPSYTILSGSQDKNFAGTDDAASSPYYGRSYCVWSRFNVSAPPIAVSYTTNGGVSWSVPIDINVSVSGHYSQGCDIRCGPNGEVYVCWSAPILGSPYTEDFAGFAKSTNGGVNWTVTNNAFDQNGIRGTIATKNNIRVNGFTRIDVDRSGGPRNGWIYIVTCDRNIAPAGSDADVILHRSTDGGTTWSAGIRVNQDPLSNGKWQWFPAIRVDEFGGVNVVFYDDRNVASNAAEVWLARSINGGDNWTDFVVSDHSFLPQPIGGLAGGYQGDYIGITSGNNKIWPVWMDNSTGANLYQLWTTWVDLGPAINHTPLGNTSQTLGNRLVQAQIIPAGSGINPSQTKLLWSRNQTFMTDSVLMTNTTGNNWQANLAMTGSGVYRYYLRTVDSLGRVATSPPGAPANVHTFNSTVLAQFCKSTYVPIRDFTTSLDSFFVNATGTLTDINFRMDTLYHTFDGDVSFWIRSPQGTEVLLANQRGGGGQNYIMTLFNDSAATFIGNGTPPFTGSFRPENPLSALNGQSIYGWWRLRVYDASATDTGSVRRWCMFLETVNFTGIEETESQLPTKFELSQNFPNPFNPTTTIRYSVVKQVPVKLVVYDILGREVSVLVNEVKNPGRYDVNFDASRLATGVYLYKLQAGDFVDVKKMVLVK